MFQLAQVIRREFSLVFKDVGVILFFILLPLLYPVVYTLIYNPELVRDLPVVVVDQSGTAESRALTRMADATEAISVVGYAPTLDAARAVMAGHDACAILVIPDDYARRLGRGQQAVVQFYSEMSLLIRYRAFVSALTDLQLAAGAEIQQRELADLGIESVLPEGSPVNNEAYFLGDPTQGFASFIIPGIIVLILQQSLVLGAAMIQGGHNERRRLSPDGSDPLAVAAAPWATVMGKILTYTVIYLPLAIYVLHYVPLMFSLPHVGSLTQIMSLITPMLIASGALGIVIGHFLQEREAVFPAIVVTSVAFLFLSGITWPHYAMPAPFKALGALIPATHGLDAFVHIDTDGADLSVLTGRYLSLWLLAALYTLLAIWLTRRHPACRPVPAKAG